VINRRTLLIGLSATTLIAARPVKGPERLTLIAARNRKVEIWKWHAKGRRKGRIHFSHGNFSSPAKYDALLSFWASKGWDVLAPLHVDSTDHPDQAQYGPMDSWAARLEDLSLLANDLGDKPYIATGHSYGALMALVMGGVQPMLPGAVRDKRVKAVVALSPPGPMPGFIDATGYAKLGVPALIQTGDKDIFPGWPPEAWRDHLAAFEAAAPGGNRHAVALNGVDHYFGGVIGRPELPGPRAQEQFDYFKSASIAFLRFFEGKRSGGSGLANLVFLSSGQGVWYRK
jgi:dienelactone hydrolase